MKIKNTKQNDFIEQSTQKPQKMRQFGGYAIIFDVEDLSGEIITKSAIEEHNFSLLNTKVLWQHDQSNPIGYIKKFNIDEIGLFVSGAMSTENEKGAEAISLIEENIIDGLSIGYDIIDYFTFDNIKHITKLLIYEVSIVSIPANQMCKIKLN